MKSWWSPPVLVVLFLLQCIIALVAGYNCNERGMCRPNGFFNYGRDIKSEKDQPRIGRDLVSDANNKYDNFHLIRRFQPFQEKRFLRFGRSDLRYDDEEYNRKRRSLDTDHPIAKREYTSEHTSLNKRAIDDDTLARDLIQKRFLRFGRGFNVEKDDSQFDKRFMRIGKRFMRFGKSVGLVADRPMYTTFDKRHEITDPTFMKFGKKNKSVDPNYGLPKFMKFGKRDNNVGPNE